MLENNHNKASSLSKSIITKNARSMTEAEQLLFFKQHADRLYGFTRRWRNAASYSVSLSKNKIIKSKNMPTELRLSAVINELRPFFLKGDPIYFESINKIIKRQNQEDCQVVTELDQIEQEWRSCYSKNKNRQNIKKIENFSLKIPQYNIDIDTYDELLEIFFYGKYIHNDGNIDNTKFIYLIEQDAQIYGQMRLILKSFLVRISIFFKNYADEYIKDTPCIDPITKYQLMA